MTWPNQNPPATDVILHINVPCAGYGAASPCYLEIDKLDDGRYRATVGTLFEHEEICRTDDLEALTRQANAMAGCRSFEDVVDAFRAMRLLGRTNRINGRRRATRLAPQRSGGQAEDAHVRR